MRQVLGIVLLVLCLTIDLLVLLLVIFAWIAAHRPGAKRGVLTTVDYGTASLAQPGLADAPSTDAQKMLPYNFSLLQSFISGKLTGTTRLETPLSHQPCTVWNVTIYHWDSTKNSYDEQPIWSYTKAASLEIPFEQTRHRNAKQARKINEGGVFRPNGAVELKYGYIFPHRSQLAPMTTAYLSQLQQIHLPPEIATTIGAAMDMYGVKEAYLTTGDAIQGEQSPQQFTIGPGSQERSRAAMAGCLLIVFIVSLGIGALIGYSLLA